MNDLQRFRRLYAGLDRVRGSAIPVAALDTSNPKVPMKCKTLKEKVLDEHFIRHLEGKEGLGLVPIRDDQKCVFAAIDIDIYPLDLTKLITDVTRWYNFLVPIKSKSGGCHLTCFFKTPIKAEDARHKMDKIAESLGFPAQEIYPKQKVLGPDDWGNWLNLGYFGAWNDKIETSRIALDQDFTPLSFEEFLTYAEERRVTPSEFYQVDLQGHSHFIDGPPCLQKLSAQGFPDGSRNNSLFNCGVYMKRRYPDHWESKLDDLNIKLMKPPLSSNEVTQTKGSLKSKTKNYSYMCDQLPIKSHCNKDVCVGREYGVGGTSDGSDWRAAVGGIQIGRASYTNANGHESTVIEHDTPILLTLYGEEQIVTWKILSSQTAMQQRAALAHRKYPRKCKDAEWQNLLQEWIEGSMYFDLDFEATRVGNIEAALRDFCHVRGGAINREEIDAGKVWEDENGYLWFKKMPFQEFMINRKIITASNTGAGGVAEAYAMMRKFLGCEEKTLKIDTKKNITRRCWRVRDWDASERPVEQPVRNRYHPDF